MFYTKSKEFKTISENPSILGFGCMRFPLIEGTDEVDKNLAFKMIDYAYKSGVNYFDTAYFYHGGKSEIIVGEALKNYPRESFYLADKMPTWNVTSLDEAVKIFNEQLEKCGVDYFDFYLLHGLNKTNFEIYKIPGIMDFLYEMKKTGKIRHLGFSFHDNKEVLCDIMDSFEFDFVQLQINYFDWEYQNAKELYSAVRDKGLPVIVMEPVRGGRLADLGDEPNSIFKEYNKDASIASWALRYVGGLDNVITVLSGMSSMEQVADNIETMKNLKSLSNEEMSVVERAVTSFKDTNKIIPCTACRYCMDCPFGVDIPRNFSVYNNFAITKNEKSFDKSMQSLEGKADRCVGCGRCVKKCPQNINIPKRLAEIAKL